METLIRVLTEEFKRSEVFRLIPEAGGLGVGKLNILAFWKLTFSTQSFVQTSKDLNIQVFARAEFRTLTTVCPNGSVKAKYT